MRVCCDSSTSWVMRCQITLGIHLAYKAFCESAEKQPESAGTFCNASDSSVSSMPHRLRESLGFLSNLWVFRCVAGWQHGLGIPGRQRTNLVAALLTCVTVCAIMHQYAQQAVSDRAIR
jgi:hypothetical protein